MLTPVALVHLQLVLWDLAALVREHTGVDEQSFYPVDLLRLDHQVGRAGDYPATTRNASHADLGRVDAEFLRVVADVVDRVDKVLLALWALDGGAISEVDVYDDALQIIASNGHERRRKVGCHE